MSIFNMFSSEEKEGIEIEFHLYKPQEEATTPDELIRKLEELKEAYSEYDLKLSPGADYWYMVAVGEKKT